eukprot:5369786-Pyramimonas_sp.AAC.1
MERVMREFDRSEAANHATPRALDTPPSSRTDDRGSRIEALERLWVSMGLPEASRGHCRIALEVLPGPWEAQAC